MKIAVVGTGYVGLVTGTCLADFGHDITCLDINQDKIDMLNKGEIPIYEPGLKELVDKNVQSGRLKFSTQVKDTIKEKDIIFTAVGTPPKEGGEADVSAVEAVTRTVAEAMLEVGLSDDMFKVIVNKSTVPIGMGKRVENILNEKGVDSKYFAVVSNPEFLREGSAVGDSMRPNRIVVGSKSEKALDIMQQVYRPLYLNETPFVRTTLETAELIKYASNCFLAVKISFINEMANICDKVGADVNKVSKAMGLDNRIGKYFLHAGPGYGGSCFPKDTKALIQIADELGYDLELVKAAESVNDKQKQIVGNILKDYFKGDTKGKKVALLGLAFKPNTDDMREAPALVAVEDMLELGMKVNAYDPVAMEESKKIYFGDKIDYCEGIMEAVEEADAIVLITEWNEFRELDFNAIKKKMKTPLFIDARNVFKPAEVRAKGFDYFCIGRS